MKWFRLAISDKVARKMNREQYYAARRWCRICERALMVML